MKFTGLFSLALMSVLAVSVAMAAPGTPGSCCKTKADAVRRAKAGHTEKRITLAPGKMGKLEHKYMHWDKAKQVQEKRQQRTDAKNGCVDKMRHFRGQNPYEGYTTYRVKQRITGAGMQKAQAHNHQQCAQCTDAKACCTTKDACRHTEGGTSTCQHQGQRQGGCMQHAQPGK